MGKRWVVFFQDTNALAFLSLPAALGVSKALGLEVNSLAIPRKPQQAIGAITRSVCCAPCVWVLLFPGFGWGIGDCGVGG
jgi:hypothetical protein